MRAEEQNQATVMGGQWLVMAAAILWGTTGTAQAFAPVSATPLAIGAARLALGGLALLIMAAARGALTKGGRLPAWPTLLAAAGIATYQLCFFAAVARTGVAVGTVVAIGSAPVLAGILAWLAKGERPGRRWLVATLLAIAGCSLLIVAGRSISVNTVGVILALGAGLSYAVFALANKALLVRQSPDKVMALAFSFGAFLLLPILITSDLRWLAKPQGMVVVLHLGVVTTAVAYALFARGLSIIPAATAVTLSLAEPLTAATLGVVLLGERLNAMAVAGVGLLLAGLALLTFKRTRAGRTVESQGGG